MLAVREFLGGEVVCILMNALLICEDLGMEQA